MYGPYYGGYQPFYGMGSAMPDQFTQPRGAQMAPSAIVSQNPALTPSPTQNGNGGLIWVQGEAGAKSYLVAPGTNIMLMDSESQVFYIKSADASGVPLPLRIFDYTERVANAQQTSNSAAQSANGFDPNNYITRDEFERRMASATSASVKNEKGELTNG